MWSRRFSLVICSLLLGWAALPEVARAISANPNLWEHTQPNGKKIKLRVHGDEWFNWTEDTNGFTVVKSGNRFLYASVDAQGQLVPTAFEVGTDDPKAHGLPTHTLPAKNPNNPGTNQPSMAPGGTGGASTEASNPSAIGTLKNLVVLCMFNDHSPGVHTRPESDFSIIMNTPGGHPQLAPTGSVKDYYQEVSYGKLSLESTVVVWVTLPNPEAYYANGTFGTSATYPRNAQGMVKDALDLVDPLVDFGEFDQNNDGYIDAITIIHSGYGAEWNGNGNRIWSHKWSLWAVPGGYWSSVHTNSLGTRVKVYDYHTEPALWGTGGNEITHIGVICHETGHFLGLPDLYDTDNTSSGIGSYCLMANSWGFDSSQRYPPHMSAWCKTQLGWAIPTVIDLGTYSAPEVEFTNTVYRVNRGYTAGEYLLIENRQPVGMEADMPQGGVAVWHIDETKSDNRAEGYPAQPNWPVNHYKISLLQADGRYDLERNNLNRGDATDLYRVGYVAALGPTTIPNLAAYLGGVFTTNDNTLTILSPSGVSMDFTLSKYIPPLSIHSAVVQSESLFPANGMVDPGELVTVNFGVTNIGAATTNLVVTLLTGNGIETSSGSMVYGALPTLGPEVFQPFTFTATGQCGSVVYASFSFQDGSSNLGTYQYLIPLGMSVASWQENFDTTGSGLLPAGWTNQAVTNAALIGPWQLPPWRVTNDLSASSPNAIYAPTPNAFSDTRLISPWVEIRSAGAQLYFQQNFSFESDHDGGILEIAIAPSTNFVEITAAGGAIVQNGYRIYHLVSTNAPLGPVRAWTGASGGFISTIVNVPATAIGHQVQFRWRCTTDRATSLPGWWVDSIKLVDYVTMPTNSTNTFNLASKLIYPAVTSEVGLNLAALQDGGTNYTLTSGFAYAAWTNPLAPCTFTMDLKQTSAVSSVKLLLASSGTQPRYYTYRLESSTDGINWTVATNRTTASNPDWEDLPFNPGLLARYLRLTGLYCSSGSLFPVVEWEVYGEDPVQPRNNLAAIPTIKGTSGKDWDYLIDGSTNTALTEFGSTVWTNLAAPGAMTLDLQQVCSINSLRLLLYSTNETDTRYYQFQIEGSSNRTNWTMLADRTSGVNQFWQELPVDPAIPLRYLRLTGTFGNASKYFEAIELEAWGKWGSDSLPPAPSPGLLSNLSQSSTTQPRATLLSGLNSIAFSPTTANAEASAVSPAPEMGSVTWLEILGPGSLAIWGEPGIVVQLQATTDMLNNNGWTTIAEFILTNSPTIWTDPSEQQYPSRIYRLITRSNR
jgi:M6 family metalloprotease-like protein